MDTSTVNVLSICSGVAGLELGLRSVIPGLRTVCYVEREISVCQILAARIRDGCLDDAPVWTDLTTFDPSPWAGRIHLIAGGVPCTPFSLAGERREADDERNLFPEVLRIAAGLGYPSIFLENVGAASRYYYDTIRPELRAMGYATQETLVTAEEVGAPHRRERLFILAHAASIVSERTQRGRDRGGQPETATGDRGRELADAGGEGLQRVRPARETEHQAGPGHVPLFPPGPDDAEGWAYMLNVMPQALPTFCREIDGPARNVGEQLRAIGNGVVPSVAARAWQVLSGEPDLYPAEKGGVSRV